MLNTWRPTVLQARLRRFLNDGAAFRELRGWLPTIATTGLISSAVMLTTALQTERYTNELLSGFASERIRQIADDLTAETNDWAVWDETHNHLLGRNPDYFERNYNLFSFSRSPFVAIFDQRGKLVGSATYNASEKLVQRLPDAAESELADLIPPGDPLKAMTFMTQFQGKPYLMSAQPVRSTRMEGDPTGRLLFVRPLAGNQARDQASANRASLHKALGIRRQAFLPMEQARVQANRATHPLGPLRRLVPHESWSGQTRIVQLIERIPSERIAAVEGIAGLMVGGVMLAVVMATRSSLTLRASRYQTLRAERTRRHMDRTLAHQRSHDQLTGLLSDIGMEEAVARQRQSYPDFVQAVVVLDLDHFAVVNSALGRSGGDALLQSFGRQLKVLNHPSACVAHLAADHFACGLVSTSDAALQAEVASLSEAINNLAFEVGGHTIDISASVGACPLGDGDVSQALHHASIACSLVKLAGGRSHQFFGEERSSTLSYLEMQRMNEALLAAIRDERIRLHAQHAWRLQGSPELPSCYVELLARIHRPEGGEAYWSEPLLEAAQFCGSLTRLDEHILGLAFAQIGTTLSDPQRALAARDLVFAINITADTLLGKELPARLDQLLQRDGLEPAQICLELTEQAALRDPGAAIVRMRQLRRMGLKLALDDFGTGTTSLGYLRDLPLDYVKIDKRFIWTFQEETTSRLVLEFVVELSKEIGFQTVAEGVEDRDMLEQLRQLGISIAQGYVTTRPRPFLADPTGWIFADAGDPDRRLEVMAR
ncbi:MAG: bifunctional diguanylate cyclase/phosphodiesterase [Cyanobacteriota bacterium]|nr:bifunctional diguanylate cyclase/phosphodiesterase [Cyanobacteriota bacterium]